MAINDGSLAAKRPLADNADHCLRLLGLRQNPFSMAPDIVNFYSPPRVEAIIVEVLQHVETRMGFALLYGDVGLGKTTLSRRILFELDRRGIQTALIFNTFFQGAELLREINRDFGVSAKEDGLPGQMAALNAFLLEQRAKGRNCVIIIDDAQNLTVESLELVRQISNMETGIDKIVQIILIGQSELEEKLDLHNLRQLKSRIALKRAFRPYTAKESATYIRTKIARSGERFLLEVTDSAIRRVHVASGGSPRRINVIMGRCLYAAVAKKSLRITRGVAELAIRDVNESFNPPRPGGTGRRLMVAAAVVLLIAAPFLAFKLTRDGIPALGSWREPLHRIVSMWSVYGNRAGNVNSGGGGTGMDGVTNGVPPSSLASVGGRFAAAEGRGAAEPSESSRPLPLASVALAARASTADSADQGGSGVAADTSSAAVVVGSTASAPPRPASGQAASLDDGQASDDAVSRRSGRPVELARGDATDHRAASGSGQGTGTEASMKANGREADERAASRQDVGAGPGADDATEPASVAGAAGGSGVEKPAGVWTNSQTTGEGEEAATTSAQGSGSGSGVDDATQPAVVMAAEPAGSGQALAGHDSGAPASEGAGVGSASDAGATGGQGGTTPEPMAASTSSGARGQSPGRGSDLQGARRTEVADATEADARRSGPATDPQGDGADDDEVRPREQGAPKSFEDTGFDEREAGQLDALPHGHHRIPGMTESDGGTGGAEARPGRVLEPAVVGFLSAYDLESFAPRFQAALRSRDFDSVANEILDKTGLRLVALPTPVADVKSKYATLRLSANSSDPTRYLLFWKPRQWPPESFSVLFRPQDVEELQKSLSQFGAYHSYIDGVAGPRTTSALKAFQRGTGLAVTGLPDVETLFMLEFLGPQAAGLAQSGPDPRVD